MKISRRQFWDVRDWIDETSYNFYDPAREQALLTVREEERRLGKVYNDSIKNKLIEAKRLASPPTPKQFRLRKLERIFGAWMRLKEAKEKGETYDPLKDEQLFLTERDFSMYYKDLAAFARARQTDNIDKFPFYEEARKAIPDEKEWAVTEDKKDSDPEHTAAMDKFVSKLKTKDIVKLLTGEDAPEPYVNPYRHIGRNDPCPCGSGKKFKNCHGKNL